MLRNRDPTSNPPRRVTSFAARIAGTSESGRAVKPALTGALDPHD